MIAVRAESIDGYTRFTAWSEGRVIGEMRITAMPLVHDMEIKEGFLQHKTAEALFHYASGYVRASGFNQALILVATKNLAMQRYCEMRALPEEASQAYLMEVR